MKLISHVNGDGDLLDAWFRHYTALGVRAFHLIVHGPRAENTRLFDLLGSHPIHIEDEYEGEFHSTEKLRRMNLVLSRLRGEWIVLVDSDEFLELPYSSLQKTARVLERLRADVLPAPFLQRLTIDGSLDTPAVIDDPFRTFPLCSADLYRRMGVDASCTKHPLLFATGSTELYDAGNHGLPFGSRCRLAPVQGVTHHFKWRRTVFERLRARVESAHPWRHESAGFASYLRSHANRLPVEGAFRYSRGELFQRGLLGPNPHLKFAARWLMGAMPERVDEGLMRLVRTIRTARHRDAGSAP
jgi:hypothetical protein